MGQLERTLSDIAFTLEFTSTALIMALHTHEILATAAVKGNGAAEHTFPVDEFSAMFLTKVGTNAHIFDQTVSAEHVFFSIRVFDVHFSCAIL